MIGYLHGGHYKHTCWLNVYSIYTAVGLGLERQLFSSFVCVFFGAQKNVTLLRLESPGFGVGGLKWRVLGGGGRGHPGKGQRNTRRERRQ